MSLTEQLSDSNNRIIEDVVLVAHKLYPKIDIKELRNVIWMHWFYGTMDVVYRGNKLVSCVRWNISSTGEICDALDWWIDEKENGFRLLKNLIARNWHRYPSVKYLRFKRDSKYPNREPRLILLKNLFHSKEN